MSAEPSGFKLAEGPIARDLLDQRVLVRHADYEVTGNIARATYQRGRDLELLIDCDDRTGSTCAWPGREGFDVWLLAGGDDE